MNRHTNQQPLRILYVGTTGQFSLLPLEALLNAGLVVCGVLVTSQPAYPHSPQPDIAELHPPEIHSSLPIINPFLSPNIIQLAWQHRIPVYEIHKLRSAKTIEQLAALGANVGCVACFPRRLPPELLNLLQHGWLNIHPSLLPAYRGPAPLFWIMRDGIEAAGVTIHRMDSDFDTGDIVAQTAVALPDGVDGVMADQIIARRGAELLVDVLYKLCTARLRSHKQVGPCTTAPWPTADDFQLSLEWSARQAFNFMRGTAEWQQPYSVFVNDQQITLSRAISYTPNEVLSAPYLNLGNRLRIQFASGVLDAVPVDLGPLND